MTPAEQLREADFAVEIEINDAARPAATGGARQGPACGGEGRSPGRPCGAQGIGSRTRAAAGTRGRRPPSQGEGNRSRSTTIPRAGIATRSPGPTGRPAALSEAKQAAEQAETAALATIRRYKPVTVANRLETLCADLRRAERQLNGHTRTLCRMGDTRYLEASEPAQEEYAQRLQVSIQELRGQISYWEGVRAGADRRRHGRQLRSGDDQQGGQVKFRGCW